MRFACQLLVCASCALSACSSPPTSPGPVDSVGTEESATASEGAKGTATPSGGHLLVQLRSGPNGIEIVQVTPVKAPLPQVRGTARAQAWRAAAFSEGQALLREVQLRDPREVRGEFQDPVTGEQEHVHFLKNDAVEFAVRVPADTARIDLFGRAGNARSTEPLGSVNLPKR